MLRRMRGTLVGWGGRLIEGDVLYVIYGMAYSALVSGGWG